MDSLKGNVYGKPFEFSGSKSHGILMIHGFTATPGTLFPMGKFLSQKTGYTIRGILLPGHGSTPEEMSKTRWYHWLNAAVDELEKLRKECRKVSVVGLSMGGTITLLLSQKYALHSAVAIAPALSVYDRKSFLARFLWPFCPFTKETEYKPIPDFLNEYNISYRKIPVRCAGDLSILMRKARKGLSQTQCPILLIRAGKDETVRPEKMAQLAKKSPYPVKELLLPNSPHVCTLGSEREQLFSAAADFLMENTET